MKVNRKIKNKKQSQSIGYEGKVSIQLRKGDKVIGKKVQHNKGNLPLFQFLSYCIKGSYSVVESLRPKYIKVFTIGAEGNPVPSFENWNSLMNLESTSLVSLTFPLYTSEPNVTDDGVNSTTTFKFTIPFTQLSQYQDLNMIALYPQSSVNLDYKDGECSAYIIIKDRDEKLSDIITEIGIGEQLDDSNINLYNLFIEWKMTFKNEGE